MAQPVKSFVDIYKFFSKELTYILDYICDNVQEDMGFSEITTEIFIYGALEKNDSMLYKSINTYLNTETIDNIHDAIVEMSNKTNVKINKSKKKPEISAKLKSLFVSALEEIDQSKNKLINSDHVLLSLLKDGDNEITKLFNKHGLTYTILSGLSKNVHDVIDDVANSVTDTEFISKTIIDNIGNDGNVKKINVIINDGDEDFDQNNFLQMLGVKPKKTSTKQGKGIPYCTNLNDYIKKNNVDKLVGRKNEVDEIFRILARRKCNNVILVGEVGVGKTQIINGVVDKLISNDVPIMFRGKQIWRFNPSEMIAGTQLRGMFEERMVSMIKALKANKDAILFIDDIHNLFSEKSKGDYDTGGIISELFSDGSVQVIAATNYKGYKAINDANGDIIKKMQKLTIDKMSDDESYNVLLQNKKYYEDFHNVTYSEDILKQCVVLAKRYITDKTLPSSAIDIMDELGSYKKLNNEVMFNIIKLSKQIKEIEDIISDIILNNGDESVKDLEDEKNEIKNELAKIEGEYRDNKNISITLDDLYTTISQHTNIPIGKLKTSDKKELKNIDKKLKNVIIGQDEAIDVVSRAIKRNKVGLLQKNHSIGNFMLVGTSGTGKTLLAKTLAKEIFGDEKYLIRFDMSEYTDKTSVNKLIGASAGYVGYSEGGLLTEAVKNNKYCVLLIDEIEKANEEIYNLFLQILDEGFLTDNTGQKVDFKNTLIILTSNVGTKKASQHKTMGFDAESDDINKRYIIEKELKDKFPPEFINRLDEIIYFNNLTDDNLKDIIKLEMNKLQNRIESIGHNIDSEEEVIDYIFNIIIKDKEYGARPIIRAIRDQIENKITDLIIDNDYENHNFKIKVENNNILIN